MRLTSIPALLLLGAGLLNADTPGRHPFYLHARTDLWMAERLLRMREEPEVMRDLAAAADRVHRAIGLIDEAAVIDRKDVRDIPPPDAYPDRRSRFQAIFQALSSAKRDLLQQEDNLSAIGWRNKAVGEIDGAMEMVKRAARDDWREDYHVSEHPHYLQAVSDLKLARALLWRPDEPQVVADQRAAIHEIEEAIGEAQRAAITDGRDPRWQPPIDANLRPWDRLSRAMDALNAGLRNLQYEEDNRNAMGWRNAAIADVNHAREYVRKAVADDRAAEWFRWMR